VLALAGIATVLLSATPLPGWAYGLWTLAALAVLAAGQWPDTPPVLRLRGFIVVLAITAALLAAEWPRYRSPVLRIPPSTPIVVIGDSISSGVGSGERTWPMVLSDRLARPVVNLARPGATAQSARDQVRAIAGPGAFVLLEIGGNDLLNRHGAAAFEQHLDALLADLRAGGHTVWMFELPLFPLQNAYGRAQRAAARRHRAGLIPKRHFARVLGMDHGTLDGLHLSQLGHDEMARRVARLVRTR
jgi:acyl-CoA thioesterase I